MGFRWPLVRIQSLRPRRGKPLWLAAFCLRKTRLRGVGVSFACSDFFKSKKSIAASLLLLYPKRSRLLRLCPYKCGHNASAALPTFWEPCACLTNLSVFREPCVYGAFFLLKPLWLAAASERTSLCSDFCSRKNQSPAASFLLFRKQVRCATTFLRVCACGAFYTQIFNCIVTVCVVGGRLLVRHLHQQFYK